MQKMCKPIFYIALDFRYICNERVKYYKDMIQKFIESYIKAFGTAAPLPIAFGYSNEACSAIGKIPRCMVGAIRNVCEGEPLTLCAENVSCGGGRLYTAFAPMQERTPIFVSEVEHYKQTPGQVKEYISRLGIRLTDKPYLNFVRIDQISSLNDVEGILFFATPDILSGLCSWAFYDNNGDDASAEPVSDPTIRYATFVGMDATDKTVGIKFRAGTFVNMSYALVCGKTTPITLETTQTSDSFADGDSSISSSVIAGELSNLVSGGTYDNDAFVAAGNRNDNTIASILDGFVGTVNGAGAVSSSDDWTAWTR